MSKKIEFTTLDSYHQTECEWHNENIIDLVTKIKETNLFIDLKPVLDIYNMGINTFKKHPEVPLKVIDAINTEVKKENYSIEQVVFLLESIMSFIQYSDWDQEEVDEVDLDRFLRLFKAEISSKKEVLEGDKQPEPEVRNLRKSLKTVLQNELQNMQEHLEGLDPSDRLNFICKLMPFVMPKVHSIHSETGEPKHEGFNIF